MNSLNKGFAILLIAFASELRDSIQTSPTGSSLSQVTNNKYPHWKNPRKIRKRIHVDLVGNTVQFRCLAEGEKPLVAKWFKNNVKIRKRGRVGGYKFRKRKQLIIFENAVPSDRGLYKCVVSNAYGSISHVYELVVKERSFLHRPILQFGLPANKTALEGQDVEFKCNVYSDPHPHIQWLKHFKVNGSNIDPKTNTPYVKILKEAGISTIANGIQTLTLRNVTYADAGAYTCLAGNSIGISHKTAWLTVISAVTTPSNTTAATNTKATLDEVLLTTMSANTTVAPTT